MKPSGKIIGLAFYGGMLGTFLRVLMSETALSVYGPVGNIPTVLFINVLGSAILGLLNGNAKYNKETLSAFWKTGFTGGFTVMSAFAALIVFYTQIDTVLAIVFTLVLTGITIGVYWLCFNISHGRKRA